MKIKKYLAAAALVAVNMVLGFAQPPKPNLPTPSLAQPTSKFERIAFGLDRVPAEQNLEKAYNAHWTSAVLVADLTGSMEVYSPQVLNLARKKVGAGMLYGCTFFNDGDKKPDGPIGSTGGIYHVMEPTTERAVAVGKKTQQAGTGGNSPENDLEAVIAASRFFELSKVSTSSSSDAMFSVDISESHPLILIADATSTVRDMSLLPQVTVPINVILCGTNPTPTVVCDYLNIIYFTHGTLSTLAGLQVDFSKNTHNSVIVAGVSYTRTSSGIWQKV